MPMVLRIRSKCNRVKLWKKCSSIKYYDILVRHALKHGALYAMPEYFPTVTVVMCDFFRRHIQTFSTEYV